MSLVVKFADAEADAIIRVANSLDEWGYALHGTPAWHFLNAASKVDEAGANQQRNRWDQCPTCKGAGIIEEE